MITLDKMMEAIKKNDIDIPFKTPGDCTNELVNIKDLIKILRAAYSIESNDSAFCKALRNNVINPFDEYVQILTLTSHSPKVLQYDLELLYKHSQSVIIGFNDLCKSLKNGSYCAEVFIDFPVIVCYLKSIKYLITIGEGYLINRLKVECITVINQMLEYLDDSEELGQLEPVLSSNNHKQYVTIFSGYSTFVESRINYFVNNAHLIDPDVIINKIEYTGYSSHLVAIISYTANKEIYLNDIAPIIGYSCDEYLDEKKQHIGI